MSGASAVRIVVVTCPPGAGLGLLRQLVEERLVAGGNLVSGIRSVYRWKGKICDEPEELLLMETATRRVPEMMTRCRELHPYEVPKILTFEPQDGLSDYLAWVVESTRAALPE